MFRTIIEKLKKLFRTPTMFDDLEHFIVAGNPQSPADVEHLERGFYDRMRRDQLWG